METPQEVQVEKAEAKDLRDFAWVNASIEEKKQFMEDIKSEVVLSYLAAKDGVVAFAVNPTYYDEFKKLWEELDFGPYEQIQKMVAIHPETKVEEFDFVTESRIEESWLFAWAQQEGILEHLQKNRIPVRPLPDSLRVVFFMSLVFKEMQSQQIIPAVNLPRVEIPRHN